MALGFYKYKFMVKFWQTPDKIPSLWHTSGKVIHKIKVCGNVLASFLKYDTFWQCYGNLPLVAKLFAITLPLAVKIGTVLWHRIPLPQSCCNLVATLRQRIFFIRVYMDHLFQLLRNLNSLAFYMIENSVLYPILNISKLNV